MRDGASYATRSLALVETTETMEWAEINCTDYILQAIRCTRRLHHLRARHAFESKVWITTSIVAATRKRRPFLAVLDTADQIQRNRTAISASFSSICIRKYFLFSLDSSGSSLRGEIFGWCACIQLA